jgi:RNA polymerase sigma factor (sigma-70 family)
VTDDTLLAEEFENNRPQLRAVAYRMLGSQSEADDAVQEAWLRLNRSDSDSVENLRGWLTTVVGRICLDMLRARRARGEVPEEGPYDPIVTIETEENPAEEAELAESVGLAMLVVLETLTPAERIAFVLHDMFGVPFSEIGEIAGRTPDAARQLASRARRRVRGARPERDHDLAEQRQVIDAFLAAARAGDFEALLEVLDPDVVVRADFGPGHRSRVVRGAQAAVRQALAYSQMGLEMRPAIVNGVAGGVAFRDGELFSVGAITVRGGKIVELDFFADPERLRELDLTILD